MKKTFIIIFGLVIVSSYVHADFSLTDWQYKKMLAPSSDGGTALFGEVVFDNQIFSKAKPDLSDVRLIDNAGKEVPYVLVTEAPKSERAGYPVQLLNNGYVEGDYTSFIADLGKEGIIHNSVEIITDSKNFRREASVEGSSDTKTWLTLLSKKSIYDYSVEFNARDVSLSYSDATYRYLKVKILNSGETPLHVLGAKVYRDVTAAGREVAYTPSSIQQNENPEGRSSVVVMDFGIRGVPASKLTLQTADTNFNREVAIEGSNDSVRWSILNNNSVIFSYTTPQFTGNNLTLVFPETPVRYLRLTIFNKDNTPIHISGAKAYGVLRKLVFAYDPANSYALYYGNAKARAPEYDLQSYLAYYGSSGRRTFTLNGEEPNTEYMPPKMPEQPFSERYPNLLLIVLILAVIVVGALTFRLLKKTREQKPS